MQKMQKVVGNHAHKSELYHEEGTLRNGTMQCREEVKETASPPLGQQTLQ